MAALLAQASVASVAADEAYSDALRYMKSLPEPAVLNYAVALTASNGNFFLQRNASGREAQVGFSVGGDEVTTTNLRALASRDEPATVITFGDGTQARTAYRFFNALWSSAYDWLRYGIDGTQSTLPSPAPASPSAGQLPPAPAPLTPSPLNVIAQVSVFDTGHYRVADAGTAACDNGDEGRVLSLSARSDPDQHPLTRAVVDVQSGAICSLRFSIRPSQFAATGFVELRYRPYPPYQFVSAEHIALVSGTKGVGQQPVTIDALFSGFQY